MRLSDQQRTVIAAHGGRPLAEILGAALEEHGSVLRAAQAVGIPAPTFSSWAVRLGIGFKNVYQAPKGKAPQPEGLPTTETVLAALRKEESFSGAARELGVTRQTLTLWVARLGISRKRVYVGPRTSARGKANDDGTRATADRRNVA